LKNTNNPKRTNKENRTRRVHILLTTNPAPTRPRQGRTSNNQKTNLSNALTPQLFFLKITNNNKKSNENSRTRRVYILLTTHPAPTRPRQARTNNDQKTNLTNALTPKLFFLNNNKKSNENSRTRRVHTLLTNKPAPTRPKQGRTSNNQKTNLSNALTPKLFFLKNTNNNKKSNKENRTRRVHILLTTKPAPIRPRQGRTSNNQKTNLTNALTPKLFFLKNNYK
jgi:hypothetical protein